MVGKRDRESERERREREINLEKSVTNITEGDSPSCSGGAWRSSSPVY
jgi:hypothetical protein